MRKKVSLLSAILVLGFLASCTKYPPDAQRMQEDLVIYTQVDETKDFNQFATFAIVDSVSYIDDKDSAHVRTPDVAALLDQIILNMQNRGFVKVDKDQNPDLGISVSIVKTTKSYVYYPGWWWGYPGYYPPDYWGYPDYWWYYPYYPAYISTYASGSLIIDMFDLVNITPEKQIPIAWNAHVRALLTGRHTLDQIKQSIDQAFTQTPSIQTTKN